MKLAGKKKEKPVAPAEKKPKRKASRGSGDGLAKLKSFFADHIEKVILGAMALFALFLVYSGFSKESLDDNPETVAAAISRAQSSIKTPTWNQVKQLRQPEPDRFDQQAEQDTIDIDANAYAMNIPFHARLQEQGKRRSDPELLAPFDLEVRPGYGALAIKAGNRDSAISSVVERNATDLRSIPSELSERLRSRMETSLGGTYQGRFFVAIAGLIPYKQQFDIYQEAFQGAAEFDTERDVPKYLGLEIQRAEVRPDGSLGEWESLDEMAAINEAVMLWDGRTEELADRAHLLPNGVMPLPPLVLRDLDQWARHSTVPVSDENQAGGGDEQRGAPPAAADAQTGATGWEALSGAQFSERSRTSANDEASADTATTTEVAEPLLKVENGMLRYFDFTVEPGKTYQYRVQAILEDPNNPTDGKAPSLTSCEPDVAMRLKESTEQRRFTAWSAPSAPVAVPTGYRVLASSAEAPNTTEIEVGRRKIRIERRASEEPTINLLTLTWKADGPYDVPVPLTVGRGAVLNGVAEKAEAIDPAASRVRALSNYRFSTDAMVLDIYGGFDYTGSELTAPGFVLVRTADGRLEFHAESLDFADVEQNTIPPDEELAPATERAADEETNRRNERQPEERAPREGNGRRDNRGRRDRDSGGRQRGVR